MANITVNTTDISGGDAFIDRSDILTPIDDLTAAVNDILNGVQEADTLLLKGVSTPANPAANHLKVFVDNADGKLKRVNASGTVVDLEATGGGGGGATTLGDLTDVDLTGLADGDMLIYDAGAASFVPAAPPTGGGGGATGPAAHYVLDEGSYYQTTSTTWVDVDAVKLALTITTSGGDVLVGFHGLAWLVNSASADRVLKLNLTVDGTPHAADDGIALVTSSATLTQHLSFVRLITGLPAGSHTFKLQWAINNGTNCIGRLHAGEGTALRDTHPQFWVKEL